MPTLRRAVSGGILVGALLFAVAHVNAEPQNGWWWNPNESGRGFFIEMTGGLMFLAGYFYESDGRATWLSSGGPVTDLYSYAGRLQSYRNGQSVFGDYRPPDDAVDAGPITVTFADDSHGTITWPAGTVPIERLVFDTAEAQFQTKTGWWWNEAESGNGYSVEIQGNNAFIVAFMYDENGNPIWHYAAGPMSTPTHFEGDWLEFSGGQTLTGPYRPPGTPRNLGRISIDFAAYDDATITFTEGANVQQASKTSRKSPQAGGRSRSSRTRPFFPSPTWADNQFWPSFTCRMTQEIHVVGEAGSTGTFTKTEKYSYYVEFDQLPGRVGRYFVNQGESYFDWSLSTLDTSNGCSRSAARENITPLSGELEISPHLYYHGRVYDTIGSSVTVTETCPGLPDHVETGPIGVYTTIGSGQSLIQRPNPFPMTPLPFMSGRTWHSEPDGSQISWGWTCSAQLSTAP